MFCENCGTVLPEGRCKCPVCGTKAEITWTLPEEPENRVFCENCGYALEEGTTLCPNCGKQQMPEAPATPEVPQAPAQTGLSHTGRRMTLLGCIAAALVVVIVFCIVSLTNSRAVGPDFIVYLQDQNYFLTDLSGGTPVELGEALSDVPMVSADGERIFCVTLDHTLKVCNTDGSEARALAPFVDSFKINAQGSLVYFLQGEELYLHDLTDGLLLASNVQDYHISADGSQLVYIAKQGNWQVLYRYEADTDKTYELGRSETVSILDFSDDLQTVLYLTEQQSNSYGTLYMQTGVTPAVQISEDANLVSPLYADGSFYYTVQPVYETTIPTDSIISVYSPTLYYYDGSSSVKLFEGFLSVLSAAANQPCLTFSRRASNERLFTTCVAVGAEKLSLGQNYTNIAVNPSATKLLLTRTDDIGGTVLELMDVATDNIQQVHQSDGIFTALQFINDEDYCYIGYSADDLSISAFRPGTLYLNGQEIHEASSANLTINESFGILFMGPVDGATNCAYVCDLQGTVTKLGNVPIHEGFCAFTPDGQLVYNDYGGDSGELYLLSGGTVTLIAENVMGVLSIPTVTEAY